MKFNFMPSMLTGLLIALSTQPVIADYLAESGNSENRGRIHNHGGIESRPFALDDSHAVAENAERVLPVEGFTFWGIDTLPEKGAMKLLTEAQQALIDQSAVQFELGHSAVKTQKVQELRQVLDSLKDKKNVRLKFVGYTDDTVMTAKARAIYGDNVGLSRARAERAARYFQQQLDLPDKAVYWEGMGEAEPIASNLKPEGKLKNRRVEVQVWYDEVKIEKIKKNFSRTTVCGTQPMCQTVVFDDAEKKISIEQIIEPIRITTPIEFEFANADIPVSTLTQVKRALDQLRNYKNLQLVFIGHTDIVPVKNPGTIDVYGDNVGLSKARAREVANYFKDKLQLEESQIYVDGVGSTQPIASNSSRRGRALNRRVELKLWYDKADEISLSSLEPKLNLDWCNAPAMQPQMRKIVEYEKVPYEKTVGPIRFKSGDYVVTDQYIAQLTQLVDKLGGKNNVRIHFVGHTDNQKLLPNAKDLYGSNHGLSEFRARRVQKYVQQKLGLLSSHVSYEGKGALEPIASNNTAAGMRLNRRVEIQVFIDQAVEKVVEFTPPVQKVRVEHKSRGAFALSPFRITVDGQPVDSYEATHTADVQRCTDVALEKSRLQLQYDDLLLKPRLAVNAWPSVISYADNSETQLIDNQTTFTAYSNYPAYIDRAEIRLFTNDKSLLGSPLLTLPLDKNMQATWAFNADLFADNTSGDLPDKLTYVVRVYGEGQRFDETKPQSLWLRNSLAQDIDSADAQSEQWVSYGENALAQQNILFDSGTVTINGLDIPEGHQVYVMGQKVPVDKQGKFVAQHIIPEGLHSVEVAVLDEQGNGELFHRDLELTESDWFYVGIADITVGTRDTDGPASTVTQDDRYDDNSFADGRLAFYARGKTDSNWDITASADTREEPLEDLFKNFADKDPLILFRRLDPDYYYPTFADDSTLEEGAPTQGKFYLKAQKNKSFGLWGNFESKILDTDLAQIDRALYGGQIHYESLDLTQYGEQKTQLDVFAAEPGTQSAREEYRGTGGSLYFLRHQDITVGSERIRIEVRDKDTGLVVQRLSLSPGSDYDIDPIQGRVILNAPLSASGNDGLLVRDASIAGNENYLIVTYEFTPGFDDLNELAVGGRASQWLGDHAEIGITATKQEVNLIDQKLNAVDLTLRSNPSNYIKLEVAQSEGLAAEQRESIDGGFAFSDLQATTNLAPDQEADARRIEAGFQLGKKGRASVFAQTREAGYSAPGQLTTTDTDQYGVQANYSFTQDISLNAKLAQKDEQLGDQNKSIDAAIGVDLSEHWKVDVGARYDDRQNNRFVTAADIGERTDMTLELGYNSLEKWTAYTFAQGTVDNDDTRDENSRGGVGGSYQIQDRLKVDGELSGGNTGTGAKVGTEFQATDRTQLYIAFALENQRSDTGLRGQRGNVSGGFKSRYTDTVSIYGEERYAYGDQPVGLTHAYGVDLAPTDQWNIGTSLETGKLRNQTDNSIKRLALGVNLGYSYEKIKYAGAIEYRDDKSSGNDRVTWLLRNQMTYQNTEDWRTIAKLNWSQSESSQGEFFDGDFTEVIWGYGYRPVGNDRINTLLKYTYFFNKPAPEQVSTQNTNSDFIQRSHILSGDLSYDLTQRWSLGGKYAYRLGELAVDRVNPEFFKSRAHLFVLRADWHVVRHWDFLVEGRVLELTDAEDRRSGFLTGIYRHFGDHLKLGLGYNFTDFSDDLTDLSFDSQGVFINIVGKI